jgi:hypothetical protein
MVILNTSIGVVALPYIAGNLGATQSEATWVLTSYEPPIEPCRLVSAFWRPSGCLLTALCSTDRFYAQFHTHLAGQTCQLVLGQPLAYGGEGRNRTQPAFHKPLEINHLNHH